MSMSKDVKILEAKINEVAREFLTENEVDQLEMFVNVNPDFTGIETTVRFKTYKEQEKRVGICHD